ncbi:MAG: metal ABC transporter ATP-binding protein, partial [Methanosarcinaceae archaeon]
RLGVSPRRARRDIGYLPQYSIIDMEFPMSVWDVVLTGRLGHTGLFKRYSEDDKKAAYNALFEVSMLDYKNRQIGKLSGGERQRVFIARALAGEPKLLLLDEPTTGIDSIAKEEFYELLNKLKEKMAIVMVSHDISAVSIYVDKIACLNHRLFYHNSKELTSGDLEAAYQCPVELIAHGVPHRVLKMH